MRAGGTVRACRWPTSGPSMRRWLRCSRSGRVGVWAATEARALGLRRHRRMVAPRHGDLGVDDSAWAARTRRGRAAAAGADAPGGRGAEAGDRPRPDAAARLGGVGRADGARRSGLAAALDLPEHAHAGGRARGAGPRRQPHAWSPNCCTASATACRATSRRAKVANIPTATRSFATSRSRCARPSDAGQPTISVDTKKKELVGAVQERRPGLAPGQERPSACACTTS